MTTEILIVEPETIPLPISADFERSKTNKIESKVSTPYTYADDTPGGTEPAKSDNLIIESRNEYSIMETVNETKELLIKKLSHPLNKNSVCCQIAHGIIIGPKAIANEI